MFSSLPEMKRKDREISKADCEAVLRDAEYLVMATVDKENIPYAVPLSFVYFEGKIYFHSGMRKGHKACNLACNSLCSLAVVGKTLPVYTRNFTTYYESVIIFGRGKEVLDPQRKKSVLFALAEKYLPEYMENAEKDISASLDRTAVFEVSLDKITGKAKKPK